MSEATREQIIEVEKIDLMRIINDMWKGVKRFWLIMGIVVLLLGGVFGFRAYRSYSPMYSASATLTISGDEASYIAVPAI